MHYFDIIITMEGVISIKRKIENCFVLGILDRELNKQKIDYQLTKDFLQNQLLLQMSKNL